MVAQPKGEMTQKWAICLTTCKPINVMGLYTYGSKPCTARAISSMQQPEGPSRAGDMGKVRWLSQKISNFINFTPFGSRFRHV